MGILPLQMKRPRTKIRGRNSISLSRKGKTNQSIAVYYAFPLPTNSEITKWNLYSAPHEVSSSLWYGANPKKHALHLDTHLFLYLKCFFIITYYKKFVKFLQFYMFICTFLSGQRFMNGTSQIFTLKSAMYSSLRIFVDVMPCRTYYTMKNPDSMDDWASLSWPNLRCTAHCGFSLK